MAKAGSFKPGKGSSSTPRPVQGRNGPTGHDPKNGVLHPNTGTNRGGGAGGKMPEGTAQFKPGTSGC